MVQAHRITRIFLSLSIALAAIAGCGVHDRHLPAGSVAGRAGIYDYSPSAIQTGNRVQVWWCGSDDNASDRSQVSDAIEYESINLTNNSRSVPIPVLGKLSTRGTRYIPAIRRSLVDPSPIRWGTVGPTAMPCTTLRRILCRDRTTASALLFPTTEVTGKNIPNRSSRRKAKGPMA